MGSFGKILIIDGDLERRGKLEAILSFMQVDWVSHDEAAALSALADAAGFTVLLGQSRTTLGELLHQYPRHVFITLAASADPSPNFIGCLRQMTYHELTRLLSQAQRWCPPPVAEQQEWRLHQLLVGECPAMLEVKSLIRQVADKQANVLLLGESGTGKEVIARAIHMLSLQSEGPFVPINCGAIPAELLESELFGHEKGAFTGAVSSRKGRFELAAGGTLFLDEIGDMPLPMQVKLLRVLQERTFERVGGTRPITANVRIIAATHRDLEKMILERRFREDLYYRLNVFPIVAPPLRERCRDIPLLLHELINRHRQVHDAELAFSAPAVSALKEYAWPGNVRELSNLVERMFILCPGREVGVDDLPARYRPESEAGSRTFDEMDEQAALSSIFRQPERDEFEEENEVFFDFGADDADGHPDGDFYLPPLTAEGINLKEMLANIEIDMIGRALEASDGVVARAAEQLGMRRTTLVEKMKKYGIGREY
ncbi:sigma-54-dependent Fis family transcriptional regulator [Zobellella endophytica]|uniref:Sigma-54-dependent Fis family transcriptional regulator n=1 Tax=Zobellella endophytica TaxID=2116700 RepID=A0A2P7R7S7_9GAMM|nr:sigma-54 dependent transcriptional regulator [Zobellella endophytica]PSJ46271.1 sigma-54-dependent Fis family transcriptional regulator [Zobellella endophytica]